MMKNMSSFLMPRIYKEIKKIGEKKCFMRKLPLHFTTEDIVCGWKGAAEYCGL